MIIEVLLLEQIAAFSKIKNSKPQKKNEKKKIKVKKIAYLSEVIEMLAKSEDKDVGEVLKKEANERREEREKWRKKLGFL